MTGPPAAPRVWHPGPAEREEDDVSWMTQGTPPGEDNVFSRYAEPESGTGATWKRNALVLGLVLLCVLSGVWLYLNGSDDRALAAMAPTQRANLFRETREAFQGNCVTSPTPAAEARCHKQAEFLLRFPECDDACRGEVAPVLRRTSH